MKRVFTVLAPLLLLLHISRENGAILKIIKKEYISNECLPGIVVPTSW